MYIFLKAVRLCKTGICKAAGAGKAEYIKDFPVKEVLYGSS